MSEIAIHVENLSKSYRIAHQGEVRQYKTLREDLVALPRRLSGLARGQNGTSETFWALKDVSFDVHEGEVIGIIGRNGAGKSTLLKILSRITEPTRGRAEIYGRVGSLLEVGTGFHPELTGRENIYLSGAVLGMTRAEVQRKFDEIVAFAEIEKFLDTPAKHYSSGMYVRLGFAVAAHLEPEILLVDEVLAVGDTQFQKKCLGKMGEVAKEGRTVLFVSHNMAAVNSLCSTCLLLEKGSIVQSGDTKTVISHYLNQQRESLDGEVDLADPHLRRNSLEQSLFKWNRLVVTDSYGNRTTSIGLKEAFRLTMQGVLRQATDDLRVGFSIDSSLGFCMFNSYAADDSLPETFPPGTLDFTVEFDRNFLAPGLYTIGLAANGLNIIDWIPEAISLNIEPVSKDGRFSLRTNYYGVVVHPCRWSYATRAGTESSAEPISHSA